MRSVAACNKNVKRLLPDNQSIETIEIDGTVLTFGIVPGRPPEWQRSDQRNAHRVLVRVRAFSCNYRDKALFLAAARKGAENSFYVVGSEFAGEVVDIGNAVSELKIGDRVIGNNHFVGRSADRTKLGGIPTNHASKEYQVLDETKLIRIPTELTYSTAAAFSIGSQTAYSMIRKLNLTPGSNVLVTAARSNTSLFAISALKNHEVNVYAATTSLEFEKRFKDLGIKEVIRANAGAEDGHQTLEGVANTLGGFDCVVDPFYDLYFERALRLMACGGRYVTCGLAEQGIGRGAVNSVAPVLRDSLAYALVQNIQIIGNCLGLTADLKNAIEDYRSGIYPVVVDSVFRGNQVGAFFDRTFSSKARFGKVVFEYDA